MSHERIQMVPELVDIRAVEKIVEKPSTLERYGSRYRIVLIGEAHRVSEMEAKQEELIRLIRPQFVLDEKLKGWIYDPKKNSFKRQQNREFNKLDEYLPHLPFFLVDLARELCFTVIGCDLTDMEIEQIGRWLPKLYPLMYTSNGDRIIRCNNGEFHPLSLEELVKEPAIEVRRKRRQMVLTARKFEKKSVQPIVMVVGNWHGRNINRNRLFLRRAPIGYLYVHQFK